MPFSAVCYFAITRRPPNLSEFVKLCSGRSVALVVGIVVPSGASVRPLHRRSRGATHNHSMVQKAPTMKPCEVYASAATLVSCAVSALARSEPESGGSWLRMSVDLSRCARRPGRKLSDSACSWLALARSLALQRSRHCAKVV